MINLLPNPIWLYEMKAEAAAKRAKRFQQGGGGEKLKAKAKALEEAEKKTLYTVDK